jgi:hypothetical protein
MSVVAAAQPVVFASGGGVGGIGKVCSRIGEPREVVYRSLP